MLLISRKEFSLQEVESAFEQASLRMQQISIQPGDSANKERVQLRFRGARNEEIIRLVGRLRQTAGVIEISHDVPDA